MNSPHGGQYLTTGTQNLDPQTARDHYQGREIRVYGAQAANFDGMTTHKQDYIPHPFEGRAPPPRSQYSPGSGVPFDGTTTYGTNYVQHAMPERSQHHAHEFKPSAAPFDGMSTYDAHYKAHQLGPREHRGPAQYQRPNVPFDASTTYKDNYHAHPMPERNMGTGAPYQPAHVPFDASSTYKGDFVPHQLERRPMPGAPMPRESLPFDGQTTYGDYFKPMPIMPREFAQRQQYVPSGAKFEGMSESLDKFRAWALDPANRRGSGPPAMRPSLPFDGQTTNREMFKGWQLPPKRPALGVQLVGDMAYILIPANAPVPAMGRQVFTTVHPNQNDMSFLVLEGDFVQASKCNVLGQFDMTGMPPGPPGAAKVEVTFHVDQNGVLTVSALDLNTQRQEQWLREGLMVAHV